MQSGEKCDIVIDKNAICYGIVYNRTSISAPAKKLVISTYTAFEQNHKALIFNVFGKCGITVIVIDNPITIYEIATNMFCHLSNFAL